LRSSAVADDVAVYGVTMNNAERLRLATPADDAPCLCGSGRSFGTCCRDHLPGFDLGKAVHDARRLDDPEAALVTARAYYTQYAIWHLANTAPAIRRWGKQVPPDLDRLLESDMHNLAGDAERTCSILLHLGLAAEIGPMLERLRGPVARLARSLRSPDRYRSARPPRSHLAVQGGSGRAGK
jgi:hypothetical protein